FHTQPAVPAWPDAPPLPPHAFPTRRSSELAAAGRRSPTDGQSSITLTLPRRTSTTSTAPTMSPSSPQTCATSTSVECRSTTRSRSEEHTSELQSRFDLVCRLPLEKKTINMG